MYEDSIIRHFYNKYRFAMRRNAPENTATLHKIITIKKTRIVLTVGFFFTGECVLVVFEKFYIFSSGPRRVKDDIEVFMSNPDSVQMLTDKFETVFNKHELL